MVGREQQADNSQDTMALQKWLQDSEPYFSPEGRNTGNCFKGVYGDAQGLK